MENKYFDKSYGLPSVALTSSPVVVCTTGGYYHGIAFIAGSTSSSEIIIYDNASTASGEIIDTLLVDTGKNVWIDRYIPVVAKNGIYVTITGTGFKGALYYSPKG